MTGVYTEKHDQVGIRQEEGDLMNYPVDRDYEAALTVKPPTQGYSWLVIE